MKQENLTRCVIEKRTSASQKWVAGALALALCVGTAGISFAQRTQQDKQANRQDQRAARQQIIQNMSPEERQQYFQQRQQQFQQQAMQRWNAMTPQERQQAIAQQQQRQQQRADQQLNSELQAAGIADQETIDAIKQFMADQRMARQSLLAMARKLATDLPSKTITDDKRTTALADFRKAVADDQVRNDKALKDLDAKIGYSTNPKLETFLTLLGVLGNEAAAVGGTNAIFQSANPLMGGFGGRGGFGGGFGGGPGGGGFGGGGFGGGPGGGGGGFGGGPGGGPGGGQ